MARQRCLTRCAEPKRRQLPILSPTSQRFLKMREMRALTAADRSTTPSSGSRQDAERRLNERGGVAGVIRVLRVLEATFGEPKRSAEQKEIMIQVWTDALGEFDNETLYEAVRQAAKTHSQWPKPADLVALCREERRHLAAVSGANERRTWRDDNWHPPTPVEKARVTLLAHAVRERLGFDWYSAHMAKGEAHLIAEAGRIKAARDKEKAA